MRKVITYYADGIINRGYSTEEEALKAEEQHKKMLESWKKNSSKGKLDKLIFDLQNACIIHPDTIATCPFESLAIKGMVRVCQQFAEENKEYLSHY
jgi:hypothetical protein